MKVEIDFKNKKVSIKGEGTFKEIIGHLQRLDPDNWEEYILESTKEVQYIYPYYPSLESPILSDGSGDWVKPDTHITCECGGKC